MLKLLQWLSLLLGVMLRDGDAASGQAPVAGGQVPTNGQSGAAGQAPAGTAESKADSSKDGQAPDGATDQERKLRAEAAQHRTEAAALAKKLADAEAKLKAKEDAELSESERKDKELVETKAMLAEAEKQRRETAIKAEIKLLAASDKDVRFADPDDANQLVDRSKIEFDKTTGDPTNLKALLKDLLKAKPHLAAKSGNGHVPESPGGAEPGVLSDAEKGRRAARTEHQVSSFWR